MRIETKYNIGDEVWVAQHEDSARGEITALEVLCSDTLFLIFYKVFIDGEHFVFHEDKLYPTKEELLQSL